MLTIYTVAGCLACRKAKQWLRYMAIEFTEKNLFSILLNDEQTIELFRLCAEKNIEFINEQSTFLLKLFPDYFSSPIAKKAEIIQNNPSLVRKPLLICEPKNPAEKALAADIINHLSNKCSQDCGNFLLCGAGRSE